MFRHTPKGFHEDVAIAALKAMDGLGFQLLTNTDTNKFWYISRDGTRRYKQELAKVGDHFWDGNNGDKHTVIAVDLENSRIAVRNEDQNSDLIYIVAW